MKVKSESEVAQSCPTLSNPMDCSLPGSSAHGIFQARVLECVPLPSLSISAGLWFILIDSGHALYATVMFVGLKGKLSCL